MPTRAIRILALIAALAVPIPASALADADPASDMLPSENVFYPYYAVSGKLQGVLNAATTAAHRAGFPIKVALIQEPEDLGALPSLFNKPQTYADYLYRELGAFIGIHPPLLIVMPDGYGVQGMSHAVAARATTLHRPPGSQSDDLARAAITAVGTLAAAAGHPIRVSGVPRAAVQNGGHVSTAVTAIIFGLIAVAIATGVIRYRQTHADSR